MAKRPASEADKIIIRLPDGMRAKLHRAAGANKRSLNGEVVARLEESFATKARKSAATTISLEYLSAFYEELKQHVDELSIPDFVTVTRLDDFEGRLLALEERLKE